MPALTANFKNFNLSLSYDSLTLYFNFNTPSNIFEQLSYCQETLRKNQNFNTCTSDISVQPDFDRFVYRDDGDHNLYHQDQYPIEKSHSHMKFKFPINRSKAVILFDAL